MAEITHLSDQSFEKEVLWNKKPVLVDFWATWCFPCKQVGPVVESLNKDYNGSVKITKLDIDTAKSTAQKYQVLSIPTLILFSGGKPIKRIVGFQPKPKLKAEIDEAIRTLVLTTPVVKPLVSVNAAANGSAKPEPKVEVIETAPQTETQESAQVPVETTETEPAAPTLTPDEIETAEILGRLTLADKQQVVRDQLWNIDWPTSRSNRDDFYQGGIGIIKVLLAILLLLISTQFNLGFVGFIVFILCGITLFKNKYALTYLADALKDNLSSYKQYLKNRKKLLLSWGKRALWEQRALYLLSLVIISVGGLLMTRVPQLMMTHIPYSHSLWPIGFTVILGVFLALAGIALSIAAGGVLLASSLGFLFMSMVGGGMFGLELGLVALLFVHALLGQPLLVLDRKWVISRYRYKSLDAAVTIAINEARQRKLDQQHSQSQQAMLLGADAGNEAIPPYLTDLVAEARAGGLKQAVGREKEIRQMTTFLLRKTKANPILLGPGGVGKSAIVEGLAWTLVNDAQNIPTRLRNMRILSLDVGQFRGGTSHYGEMEEKTTNLITFLKSNPNNVLFIDEIHSLINAKKDNQGMASVGDMLKPELARGLKVIGATTDEEYRDIEKDSALERRFGPIKVLEPDKESTLHILESVKRNLAQHYALEYGDVGELTYRLAYRFMKNRQFPDKAIDILEEAGALAVTQNSAVVDDNYIYQAMEAKTGISVGKLSADAQNRIAELTPTMKSKVIGQDEAITALVEALKRSYAQIRDVSKPVGSFLFTGPTGVGKTEIAKVLAAEVFDDEKALIRFDMTEFHSESSVSGLLGSSAGYIGSEEGGRLTEAIRHHPSAVLIFDEVEKAHPSIFNIFLPMLDDGFVTSAKGVKVDCSNVIIIFTSNLGHGASGDTVETFFRPEFINRLSQVVEFKPLDKEGLSKILDLKLAHLARRLDDTFKIELEFSPAARELIMQEGYDPKFGARPLTRAISKLIENPLADYRLANQNENESLLFDVKDGEITIIKKEET
jgi:ATP-dependent Clp protease ATP-binding subunit ClpC